MPEQPYIWYPVAASVAELLLNEQGMTTVEIKGKKIGLACHRQQWFAFALLCPHAGGRLTDGHIDAAGNLVCPVHHYRYQLKNGYNSSGEGYRLKTYPVQMTEQGICIGLPKGGLLSWL